MIKKSIVMVACLAGIMIFIPQSAAAYTYQCTPDAGSDNNYAVSLNYILSDPSQNSTGTVIDDAANSYDKTAQQYTASCDCDPGVSSSWPATIYTADVNGTFDHDSGNYHFYKMNSNISFASSVYIGGTVKADFYPPFTDVSNVSPITSSQCGLKNTVKFTTGAKGHVVFYINKPFVGQVIIPSTELMRIYGSVKAGIRGTTPMSVVTLNGTITVPQSCQFDEGAVIDISYDDILTTNLKTKGSGATGSSPTIRTIGFKCTNVSDGVKVNFNLKATPSTTDNMAINTTNADVGIRVEDSSGNIISPTGGVLHGVFDFPSQKGTVTLQSFPINVTGAKPDAGHYSASATITTTLE